MLKNLKQLRESAAITQRQLAEAIGVSQQSINKYENHNIEPDIETLIRMADFFDTSVDYIIWHAQIRQKIEVTTPYSLNTDERRFMDAFRRLSPKRRACVLCVIESYCD